MSYEDNTFWGPGPDDDGTGPMDPAWQAAKAAARRGKMPPLHVPEGNNLVAITRYKGQTVKIGRSVELRVEWIGVDQNGYPQAKLVITKPLNIGVRRGELEEAPDLSSVEEETRALTCRDDTYLPVPEGRRLVMRAARPGDIITAGDVEVWIKGIRPHRVLLGTVVPEGVFVEHSTGDCP